jgi:hypothetical protein
MKKFSNLKAGEQVALIGRNSALNGEERPQLKSKALQEISDKAFDVAGEEWAEENMNGDLDSNGNIAL